MEDIELAFRDPQKDATTSMMMQAYANIFFEYVDRLLDVHHLKAHRKLEDLSDDDIQMLDWAINKGILLLQQSIASQVVE